MGEKKTTMADIAGTLGISKNAVSLALRGKGGVSDALREKVLSTAREMRYVAPRKTLAPGCILALIPRHLSINSTHDLLIGTFYQQVCFYMEAYAQSRDYQIIISSVPEAEEQALLPPPLLRNIACTGIVTIGNLSLPYCRMISGLGLRYVMVDQYYDDLPMDCVTSTNITGGYALTRHLIDNGHRRIEYFGKRYTTASLNDRFEGYCRAMNARGLTIRKNAYQQDTASDHANDLALIRKSFQTMETPPTAAVCGHDGTAKDVVEVARELGLRYPEDLSVVGYDDIQSPEVASLALTTYRTRKADIAHSAIDLLLEGDGLPCKRLSIYGEIVYRDSVRAIRAEDAQKSNPGGSI